MDFLNEKARELRQGEIRAMFDQAAAMEDVISMGIGEPDMPTPELVCRAASEALRKGITHYTPNAGTMQLREAVAGYSSVSALGYDPAREIIITNGGMGALSLLFLVLLNEGDEVLIQDPQWLNYAVQVRYCGGVPVRVPTCSEDGFQMRPEAIEGLITPRTKAILINTPNNPTGCCLSRERLMELALFCQRRDLFVVADDIYTNFCYGEEFFPIRALPGMAERTITVNSFSKNYIMTGFRVGNIVAPAAVIRAVQQLNEYVVFSAPSVSQRGALWALRGRERLEPPLRQQFRERMACAAGRINQVDWMTVPMPQGSIYLFPSIRETGLTSAQAARRILEEAHVLVLPGDTFGACGEGYLRIACTVENPVMEEAMDRIRRMAL